MAAVDLRITKLSRREVLALGISGALVLRYGQASASPTATQLNAGRVWSFISIRQDGSVLLRSPFVEGGQGIYTGLAQVIAEELDVELSAIFVECAPSSAEFQLTPGLRLTGQSLSMRTAFTPMRELGATARAMLLAAASQLWAVNIEDLRTENGFVKHDASGESVDYGLLAARAANLPVPPTVKLREPRKFRWIGKPAPRIDVTAKSNGSAKYAIDLIFDDMVNAATLHPPKLGQRVGRIQNADEVLALEGILAVEDLSKSVAVVARRWWQARRAIEILKVEWIFDGRSGSPENSADFSTEAQRKALRGAEGDAISGPSSGDIGQAFEGAGQVIEAVYDAPYIAHVQLEPPSAIARFNTDGTLEVWCPNQLPDIFRSVASVIGGVSEAQVTIHSPLLGGFFGRHFYYGEPSPFGEAIALARKIQKPVKVIWTREEEFLCDAYRPMSAVRLRAALDHQRKLVALEATLSGEGPTGHAFGNSETDIDESAIEGLMPEVYSVPHRSVSRINVKSPVRIGYWRSVGHSSNCFFVESFVNEVAAAADRDPVDFRFDLLRQAPRETRVLKAAIELVGRWNGSPFRAEDGSTRAQGVAMSFSFASVVCCVAEVSILDGDVKVHGLWTAIDAGPVVNPAIVKSQVKSAVCLGLSAALLEEITFEGGAPGQSNLDSYTILGLADMPPVYVALVDSVYPMGGVGEPGLPPVAPAVCNAIAALTGQRIRSLPIARSKPLTSPPE